MSAVLHSQVKNMIGFFEFEFFVILKLRITGSVYME